MKPNARISLLAFLVLMLIAVTCQAKLELGGNIFAEFISDPKNFDPSISRTDPWRSGDQGGIVFPGYYVGQFTKINLNLKLTNEQTEAFIPLTFSVNPFSLGSGTISWQAILIAEDYLNIPYYFTMKAPYFSFAASSKPVGEEYFGFQDFQDPLGIMRRPNSLQPIFTFKVDADLPRGYSGNGYVLFDQKVMGVPIWERIPESVASEKVGNNIVREYGFIDEVAQYTLVHLDKQFSQGQLSFFAGRKNVENPSLRMKMSDGSLTEGNVFSRWGYEKNNYGLAFQKGIKSIEIKSTLVNSDVKWYQYDTQREIRDQGYFVKQAICDAAFFQINQ